jgi:hypothetical protein
MPVCGVREGEERWRERGERGLEFASRLASAVGEAVTDLVSTRGRGKVKVGTQVHTVPPSPRPIYSQRSDCYPVQQMAMASI